MKQTTDMPANKIKYYGFPQKTIGAQVFGVEHLSKIRPELELLNKNQWNETEAAYLGKDFTPNYDYLIECEKEYRLILFTARETGVLIGNLVYFLTINANKNSELQAQENSFYTIPEARKTGIGENLLKYAEAYLIDLGVKQFVMMDKSPLGGVYLGDFFSRQGYKPVALSYFKRVE